LVPTSENGKNESGDKKTPFCFINFAKL